MDVEVSEEGQRRICRFSALHRARVELDTRIEKLKKELQLLSDAQEEVISAGTSVSEGDCYVEMDAEAIETALNEKVGERKTELEQCERQLEENKSEALSLKKELYREFGNRINLDT